MLKSLTTDTGQGNWSVIGCTWSASLFICKEVISEHVFILLVISLDEVKIGIYIAKYE